jgi:Ca2+-binding RTX toxin-like protein
VASFFDEVEDAAGKVVDVIPDLPDIDPSDLSDLSDLPNFDEALRNSDGETVIDLIGDNDITTGDGDDLIVTGLGDDTIDAGDGDNTVYADNVPSDSVGGDDEVTTGSGDDEIYTFGNEDVVNSGAGADIIFTADDDDIIDAGSGADDVQSGRGEDAVLGRAGDDELRGGEDDDDLRGGAGSDRVIGGSDDDALRDGDGVDQLEGRTGDDTAILTADAFTDTVVFMADDVGNGVDTIRGFNTAAPDDGGDLIDLREVAGDGFELAENSGDVLIFADPAGEIDLTLLARVEGVDDEVALADNILDGGGAGAALVAEAGDGDLIPLGPENEPVSGFADAVGDEVPTEAARALSPAQVLDDGAAPVSGPTEPAFAALIGLGEAGAVETGPSLDQMLANPDAVV